MTKKPNALMAGLSQFDRKTEKTAVSSAPVRDVPPERSKLPPSRVGMVQIAAFFPDDVRAQLKIIAAEQRRDMQDLIAEGLNLIFVKYGKAEIAPRK
jgi:hypothetical protein